jgi:serine/threonine protein phosphatase PrpC
VSDVSNISYAGYLLKRSNRPFAAVSPFPIAADYDDEDDGELGASSSHSIQPRSSSNSMMMMTTGQFRSNSSLITAADPDWSVPTQSHTQTLPQHLLLEPAAAATWMRTAVPSTEVEPNHQRDTYDDPNNNEHIDKQHKEEERPTNVIIAPLQAAVEQSLQFAANFFSMKLPANTSKNTETDRSASPATPPLPPTLAATSNSNSYNNINGITGRPSTLTRPVPRSSPIKMVIARQSQSSSSSQQQHQQQHQQQTRLLLPNTELSSQNHADSFVYSRMSSLPPPSRSISDVGCQPADYIDPNDGHIWRAKYCVLEDGILYFYRHQADAETPQAHAERQEQEQQQGNTNSSGNNNYNNSNMNMNRADLAKSPMPRGRLIRGLSGESANFEIGNGDDDDDHDATMRGPIWEKRVELDGVGAVRSAEMEFGGNAFELAAADENSDDKLVLRARNSEEMNEWLFQFHRSIATFVMNIMDHVGSVPRSNLGDLHHPAFSYKPLTAIEASSPIRSVSSHTYSPRFQQYLTNATPSLSHGHGRSALHRRRVDGLTRAASAMESPEPPTMPFALTVRDTSAPSSRTVTPIVATSTRRLSVDRQEQLDDPPELSAPQSDSPETERPPPSNLVGGRYIPPHLRNRTPDPPTPSSGKYVPPHLKNKAAISTKYVPPHLRNNETQDLPQDRYALHPRPEPYSGVSATMEAAYEGLSADGEMAFDQPELVAEQVEGIVSEIASEHGSRFKRGGCADPTVVAGSVRDAMYVPRKASRLGKVRTDPFGCFGNDESDLGYSSTLRWEIGAVSECGVRESNEDSYLIASNLSTALDEDRDGEVHPTIWSESKQHPTGLFAIFDGHCGDQAARFAAEKLPEFIRKESMRDEDSDSGIPLGCSPTRVQDILHKALVKLDKEFCDLCVEEGRAWESGATALVAMLAEEHLIIGNLGDARGIISRSIADPQKVPEMEAAGWNALPIDDYDGDRGCLWKEVTDVHSPGRKDERARIEKANGWITTETEIPIGQFKRMVLLDEDVYDILKRCFADRYQPSPKASAPQRILHISRVCGELAVSRAIGDRDFKAAFNRADPANGDGESWDCPIMLPFPDDRSRYFVGDLVSNTPDFQALPIGEEGVSDEFLLLACDGLWDVIDAEDAVRVTRDLLFEKQWPAKQAAARLAELAIHLGSSDNITVIVVRFFNRQN